MAQLGIRLDSFQNRLCFCEKGNKKIIYGDGTQQLEGCDELLLGLNNKRRNDIKKSANKVGTVFLVKWGVELCLAYLTVCGGVCVFTSWCVCVWWCVLSRIASMMEGNMDH